MNPNPVPATSTSIGGPDCFARHAASFPDFFGSSLTSNIGWLGLQYVLENGGSGYFPIRLVRPHLQSGRLTMLSGGPEFMLSAYVVYPSDADPAVFGPALDVIRQAAATESRSATTMV